MNMNKELILKCKNEVIKIIEEYGEKIAYYKLEGIYNKYGVDVVNVVREILKL